MQWSRSRGISVFSNHFSTDRILRRRVHTIGKKIFVAGTNTDVGKTIVSSWLCLHSKWEYFKPISSSARESESDTCIVKRITGVKTHPEIYNFSHPVSPHLAGRLEGIEIKLENIILPKTTSNLLIEGAGGLLVPLNTNSFLIDFIQELQISVILVASSQLGTINHTLLSLEALRRRSIDVTGVILKGHPNQENSEAIEHYGKTRVLAQVPHFEHVTSKVLLQFPLSPKLRQVFL